MSLEQIQFLSGWTVFDPRSMVMTGRKATLEIENNGGDLLILEYAYPGQLSRRVFPPECETADCTVRRWNTRVCIIHQ